MAGMFPTNKEISVFGKKIKFPGVTDNGEYTNGNFENPDEPPSYLDADTQNLILHNLNNLIAQLSGKEANNTDRNQLAALFTVAATALRGVQRDAGGRAKVASPVEDDDIARKKEVDDVGYELGLHIADTSNPHEVTKAQVGLGNVDNTADKDKAVKSAGTCTGNAATAGKWQTARNLNGLSIQGDADRTNYAVCSTAAGTQAKTCGCAGFALVTGAEITVKFSATNTQNAPTLNVNGTGAKAIYYRGAAIPAAYLATNRTYTFRYNGSQYELVGDIDTSTTYSVATSSAAGLMSATDKTRLDGNYVTASNFGSSSGYIKYSNGLIIQWIKTDSITGVKKIGLPLTLTNTNYSVFLTTFEPTGDSVSYKYVPKLRVKEKEKITVYQDGALYILVVGYY